MSELAVKQAKGISILPSNPQWGTPHKEKHYLAKGFHRALCFHVEIPQQKKETDASNTPKKIYATSGELPTIYFPIVLQTYPTLNAFDLETPGNSAD